MLKFNLITDTHLWSEEKLGFHDRLDQVCLNESVAIIDAAFEKLASNDDSDIVLIAGDLTNNGERENHKEIIKRLYSLKSNGKRVYVITATHDYGLRNLDDNGIVINSSDDVVQREELRKMYNDFGYSEALSVDDKSMSYVVQLSEGYRLLCLNDDGNGRSFCGYYEQTMQWILEQIELAKKDNQFIFAMTHHPVLPPFSLYPLASRRDMLGDFEKTSRIFADSGLRFIFTGHTHVQNISNITTPSGNKLYDINTGSLCGYPAPIRSVTIDDESMIIKTESVDDFECDKGEDTSLEFLDKRFKRLLRNILTAMGNDYDEFSGMVCGMGVERNVVEKFRKPITAVGKKFNSLTIYGMAKLLMISKCVDDNIKDELFVDFLTQAAANIWSGNQNYGSETSYGKFILALGKRINPVAKPFLKKLGFESAQELLMNLVYDPGDTDAVLPLKD